MFILNLPKKNRVNQNIMAEQFIKFEKQRNFEQLISHTFDFIKQEFKPIVKALLTFTGPFVLVTAFLMSMYQSSMSMSSQNVVNSSTLTIPENTFSATYFLLIISSVVSNTVLLITVYGYIKLYITKGKGNFEIEEIWKLIINKFSTIFLALIAMSFMIAIGIVTFIVPGVYLAIIFSLVLPIMVFEELTFNQAVIKSINLIKNYWGFSFAVIIVIYLITFFAGFVFSIPQLIISSNNSGSLQTINKLLIIFGTFFSTLLYALPYVTIAFHYFSQLKKKEE